MGDNDAWPLADTEVHYLHSDHVGDEFKIFIGHCGDARSRPPAVLYLTDANGLFGGAVDIIRLLQLSDHLPPVLVVGIGYRRASMADIAEIRTRDLTPTVDPVYASWFPEQTRMGGAPPFLDFIRHELMPWVATTFPSAPGPPAYFGHSLGGLFGTWVLLTAPDTFASYGIGSPSLWWHDDMAFTLEQSYAEAHDDLAAAVFFGVGGDEDHGGRQREAHRLPEEIRAKADLRFIDMAADSERMVDRLRGRHYPSLRIASVVLPGEFHITVPFVNLSRALRYLFDAPT